MFGLTIVSKKKYEEELATAKSYGFNNTFNAGYKLGYDAGKQDLIFEKYTPNEIRAAFGCKPIGINGVLGDEIQKLFEEAHNSRTVVKEEK